MPPVLRLKRGHERARVHPWIFKGDVANVGAVEPGEVVTVVEAGGRFVGRGFFNPRPALCCRILTRQDEPIDATFFAHRVRDATALRGPSVALGRLVWSEGDGLPGLVVDRYGDVLALQCLTLGMARSRPTLVAAVRAALGELPVFSADDQIVARLEGFTPERGWVDRAGPDTVVVDEDGVKLRVMLGGGHKTGLYLDQRVNHRRVADFAAGRQVLDAFAYTAAFACHALVRGARGAVCIESSHEALAAARENFALNGVANRAELVAGNVFDELRRLEREGARFGLIVLDPPPFARSRAVVEAAARGYKEINLRAIQILKPGGVLVTSSCSYHMPEPELEALILDAANDAGRRVQLLERRGAGRDHPALMGVPETRYLKCFFLRIL
jgi:23S rRNA (cytosine1962-C5)-methyltransferase